jgi:flagellar biosynthesis/type III secretory pathway M-ring protein FliF/YscJ
MGVIIVCVIIVVIIIGLTFWITNKAYEVLPSVSKVDPLPDELTRETSENTKLD